MGAVDYHICENKWDFIYNFKDNEDRKNKEKEFKIFIQKHNEIISKFSEGTFKITDSYILFDAMITIEDQFPDDTWGVESTPPPIVQLLRFSIQENVL